MISFWTNCQSNLQSVGIHNNYGWTLIVADTSGGLPPSGTNIEGLPFPVRTVRHQYKHIVGTVVTRPDFQTDVSGRHGSYFYKIIFIRILSRVVMDPVFFPVHDDIDLPVDPAAVSDSLRRLLLRYYYLSIILSMTYLIRPDKENFGTTDER